MGWTWVGIGVWAVVLAGCGPTLDDDDVADIGSESESSGAAPSTSTADASGSASATSSTPGEGSTSDADEGSSSADGLPPPPEGGEIGEGGDCSCCGSSLRVTWPSEASEFTVALVSETTPPFVVTCPAATVAGAEFAVEVGCGAGEIVLRIDGLVDSFVEGSWRVTIDDEQPVSAPATCDYGSPCDCNCVPSDCEIVVESER